MSFQKLSDDELELKLPELVDFIKSQKNMPQNVGKGQWPHKVTTLYN